MTYFIRLDKMDARLKFINLRVSNLKEILNNLNPCSKMGVRNFYLFFYFFNEDRGMMFINVLITFFFRLKLFVNVLITFLDKKDIKKK
jgi:hypothetical protein